MHAKLGLDRRTQPTATTLIADLLSLMGEQRVDYTSCLRSLSSVVRGDAGADAVAVRRSRCVRRLERALAAICSATTASAIADRMDRVNPIYIPRNHLVEEALTAATGATSTPFDAAPRRGHAPVRAARRPRALRVRPAPADAPAHRTFCGT